MRPRAVVVGAGISGSVLASRIAEKYDVVVVEAGHRPRRSDADSAPDAPEAATASATWALPGRLTSDRRWTATPGRAVGGSSVVNGGYFAVPDSADLEAWRVAGGPAWEPLRVLSHIAAIADRLGVHPSPQTDPIAAAFAESCAAAGHADGLLMLGTTVEEGVPRNVAEVFLSEQQSRIEVRTDCRALRVVTEAGRATGVEVASGDGSREVLEADEVILCAGGFGTARLLLASGIGPAGQLGRAGIDVVSDVPGVGAAFSDHPTVWVEWMPTSALARSAPSPESGRGAFPLALRIGADGGSGDEVEILACTLPPDASGSSSSTSTFGVIVGLQRPMSRGTVAAASAHPFAPATIAYGYLEAPEDRAAMRTGVRAAADLLRSPAFAALVEGLVDLDDGILDEDDMIDAWIAGRLGSAAHTCGTAPMGPDDDPRAVVDGAGRVRGIAGLRVADTSLLPVVPLRAPAPAAMAIGAIIADQL